MWLAPLLFALIAPAPRLEATATGAEARRLVADVILEGDAIAELVLVPHGAVLEVEAGRDRREVRLALDPDGAVVGATVWWIGPARGARAADLELAVPALAAAGTLDAITVVDDVLAIHAGAARIPIGDDLTDELELVW